MSKKSPIRVRAKATFAAAGLVSLRADAVPSGYLHCYQQTAWTIDTVLSGGNTRVLLYIETGGYKHFLEEQSVPVAGSVYTYDEPLTLRPGERLCLDLDQAQAGTIAEMCLTGYETDVADGMGG